MLYIRGNRKDYDLWESRGSPDWGHEDIFEYFIKSEYNSDILKNGYHGSCSHPTVLTPHCATQVAGAFLEAAKLFRYPNIDLNGYQQMGFAVSQGTARCGARFSTANAFLENLHCCLCAR